MLVTIDDDGVAGVVATLVAGDDVEVLGEPVDDLALALVTPLGAQKDHVRHADELRPGRDYGSIRGGKNQTPGSYQER